MDNDLAALHAKEHGVREASHHDAPEPQFEQGKRFRLVLDVAERGFKGERELLASALAFGFMPMCCGDGFVGCLLGKDRPAHSPSTASRFIFDLTASQLSVLVSPAS